MHTFFVEPWRLMVFYESQDDYLAGHKDLKDDGWEIVEERVYSFIVDDAYGNSPSIVKTTRECKYVNNVLHQNHTPLQHPHKYEDE